MVKITDNALPPPELIKVGYTTLDPDTRRVGLNTGNPYRLQYVAIWKVTDGKAAEKAAHDSLYGLEAKPYYGGGSEWFMLPKNRYVGAQTLIQEALKSKKMLASTDNWVSAMIQNMDYKRRSTHK